MTRCALIGYGYWGKRFLPYLSELFDVRHVYSRTMKDGVTTTDLDQALSDVDCVVIATPIDTHYEVALKALLAGKHVLCEKPLAQRSLHARELISLAEHRHLHLVTEFTYTFSEGIRKAKELISEGVIGDLEIMELSLRYVGKFVPFSVHWLLTSHMLSVVDMFCPLSGLASVSVDELIPKETSLMRVRLTDDTRAIIFTSLNYPDRETRIAWYGTGGTMVYNALSDDTLSYATYRKTPKALAPDLVTGAWGMSFDEKNNLGHAARHFLNIINGDRHAASNTACALHVTSILESYD